MEVKDIVKEAVTVPETATLREVVTALVNGQTNTLLVVNEDGVLTGEVSVVDLFDAIVPPHLDGDNVMEHFSSEEMFIKAVKEAEETSVEEFMTYDYSAVEMHDDLITIAATAVANQRARIPVVDSDGRPVGIISRQGLKQIIAKYLGISPK